MRITELFKQIDFLGEKMRFNISSEKLYGTCLGFILTFLFIIICITLTVIQYNGYKEVSKPLTISQETHTTSSDVFNSPDFGEAVEPIIWLSLVNKPY